MLGFWKKIKVNLTNNASKKSTNIFLLCDFLFRINIFESLSEWHLKFISHKKTFTN